MERGQLEAFIAVTRLGSITRAAEELFLAQSSLSARIRALEEELGAPVFDRSPKGIVLTGAGQRFLPFAQAALETMEDGRRAVQGINGHHAPVLDVGVLSSTGTYLLPRIMEIFGPAQPDVDVRVQKGCSEEIVDWLLRGRVAVGLTREAEHPDIVSRCVYPDELVLVCGPCHPFAASGQVTLEELAEHGLVFYSRKPSFYDFFRAGGVTPRFRHAVDTIGAVKEIVALNLSIGIVPLMRVKEELEAGELRRVAILDVGVIPRHIYVTHTLKATTNPMVNQFVAAAERLTPS